MILLEVLRQLETYEGFQIAKHKTAISFPFFVGNMLESCSTTQAAEGARLEMQWYPFNFYQSRSIFDPHNHIGLVNGEKYKHRMDLEDFWVNAIDESDIRRRLWSRLPINLIRRTELFRVPDELEDDGEYTQPCYDENRPLSPVRWS